MNHGKARADLVPPMRLLCLLLACFHALILGEGVHFNCLVAVFQPKIMFPAVVLALCVTAALSAPSLDPQLDDHWNLWKDWHSKTYHEVTVRLSGSAARRPNGD